MHKREGGCTYDWAQDADIAELYELVAALQARVAALEAQAPGESEPTTRRKRTPKENEAE